MPVSEKQLEANRRNAQRSTGPRTAEGKARSSLNNLRHGLTGQITVLPEEDREAHDAFCDRLISGFQPETPIEEQLAHFIAEDAWRLNRIAAIENNIFALGRSRHHGEIRNALEDAQSFLDHARELNLLSLYEQRIHRNMQRNLNQLRELQKEREAESRHRMKEAKLLAQQSLANGVAFDPVENGFEFSNAEINRAIDRDNRMNEAHRAANVHLAAAA
ncbi:MAG TPA: hypothetical protein VK789_00915 [Bryobacteraceae bacterium]|jgi:hypothetical protein|nr:hypothetical protein [Bryobacteraceae bacterium]